MSKGGGGSAPSGNQTVTQTADPWSAQQPYLKTGFQAAQNIYDAPAPQYYGGSTVAPFSPETNASFEAQTNRALKGSPLIASSQQQLTDTIGGKYLDPANNPYLLAGAEQIRANVLPGIEARFAGSGRLNSGMASRAASMGLADALAGQATQNYNNERNRQMQAMAFAPTMANQDYFDIQQLGDVGSQKENYAQALTNEQIDRNTYNQNIPATQLAQFMNFIQGNYGGSTTGTMAGTTPFQRGSRAGGALGGAMSGAATGSMLGPWGAAGGGILGGLLGGFS